MEPNEILEKYKPILEKNPGDPRFARVGEIHLSTGDFKNALTVLTKGVKANPKYSTGQLMLARALLEAGYLPQARERYRIVLRLDPSNIASLWHLASIAFEEKKDSEGIRYLMRIMDADPYNTMVRQELKAHTGQDFGAPEPKLFQPPPPPPPPMRTETPIQEAPKAITEDGSGTLPAETVESELNDLLSMDVSGKGAVTAPAETENMPPAEEFEELFEMDVSKAETTQSASADKGVADVIPPVAPPVAAEQNPPEQAIAGAQPEEQSTIVESAESTQSQVLSQPREPDPLQIAEDALFFEEADSGDLRKESAEEDLEPVEKEPDIEKDEAEILATSTQSEEATAPILPPEEAEQVSQERIPTADSGDKTPKETEVASVAELAELLKVGDVDVEVFKEETKELPESHPEAQSDIQPIFEETMDSSDTESEDVIEEISSQEQTATETVEPESFNIDPPGSVEDDKRLEEADITDNIEVFSEDVKEAVEQVPETAPVEDNNEIDNAELEKQIENLPTFGSSGVPADEQIIDEKANMKSGVETAEPQNSDETEDNVE